MNGLFNLDDLFDESTDMDELMNLEINMEDAEFKEKNSATNPTMDIDKDATGAHDINIPIPGGLKETPSAKPKDEQSIPIPGGLSETPTSKPKDAMSISVPGGTVLNSSVYNDALTNLQKSFKESIEVIEMMKQVQIYDESYDDLFIESITDDDKYEVSDIAKSLKMGIKKFEKDLDFEFVPYSSIFSLFKAKGAGSGIIGSLKRMFNYHKFQIVGCVCITNKDKTANRSTITVDHKQFNSILKALNSKFKDELGEYNLYGDPLFSEDFLGVALTSKYHDKSYLIYIDRKSKNIISENLKSFRDKLSKDVKKGSPKTESVKNENECEECNDKEKKKDKKCEDKEECVKEAYELDLDDMIV